jgi:RNA polymerase sigma-70 factor (ECF subfamily)
LARQKPVTFPLTRWSLVARAAHDDTDVRRPALAELLGNYLRPMHLYLTGARGLAPDDADDLLQQFVADKVLAQDLFGKARQDRGRFRTFLLATLDHFAINDVERCRARKRRPSGKVLALSDCGRQAEPAAPGPGPADGFDLAWAREVLDRAVAWMWAECQSRGRADLWAVFADRVLNPILDGAPPTPYEQLLPRLGLRTEQEAANLLVTAKRLLGRGLRAVVAEYESDPADVDAEIADLRAILARGADGGRSVSRA